MLVGGGGKHSSSIFIWEGKEVAYVFKNYL